MCKVASKHVLQPGAVYKRSDWRGFLHSCDVYSKGIDRNSAALKAASFEVDFVVFAELNNIPSTNVKLR